MASEKALTDAKAIAVLRGQLESVEVKIPLSEGEMDALLWTFKGWLRQKIEELDTQALLDIRIGMEKAITNNDARDVLLRAFGLPPESPGYEVRDPK